MADYDKTIGVHINEDFGPALELLQQVATMMEKAESATRGFTNQLAKVKGTIDALKQLASMNMDGLEQNISKAVTQIERLNEAFQKINTERLNSLKTFMDSFGKFNMSGIEKMKDIPSIMQSISATDANKVGRAFSTLDTQITPFLAHLKESESKTKQFTHSADGMSQYNNKMEQARQKVKNVGNEATKTRKKLNQIFTVGNMMYFYNMSKQLFRGIGDIIGKSIDFTETENYFARAMGNMYNEAMKFQNKMSDMFGMAIPDMMQMQATYKNMLGSLGGLTDEMSYKLSETVSKMTLDFASLYNVSIEQATTKFQAALSKQVNFCPLCMGVHSEFLLIAGNLSSYEYGNQQVSI